METIEAYGRKAYHLKNGETELSVTVEGGHMAPVRFFADTDAPLEPYYISPWQEETGPVGGPGVLSPLRGDFFCMPFGGDNDFAGESHPPHGEVCEAGWAPVESGAEGDRSFIELSLETKIRPGTVNKRIELRKGQSALYVSHRVEGFAGPVTLGHHAIMPGDREHFLSTRPLITGICDTAPPPPSSGEYYSLAPGAFFDKLSAVPTIWKNPALTDCSVFPAREGFVDIIQLFPELPTDGTPLWFTACVPSRGYLWYSLKNPEVLPSTVLWQENRGRHGAPWKGRNICLGIEEVLSHLASGLKVSAVDNVLTGRGLRTSATLDGTPFTVRSIQGVLPDSRRLRPGGRRELRGRSRHLPVSFRPDSRGRGGVAIRPGLRFPGQIFPGERMPRQGEYLMKKFFNTSPWPVITCPTPSRTWISLPGFVRRRHAALCLVFSIESSEPPM